MGRFICFFLVICVPKCWVQAQSRPVASTTEAHNDISSAPISSSVSQPRAPESAATHPLQLFECTGTVTLQACKQEMLVLKSLLDKYGANELGQWKWVLVPSIQWEMMLAQYGLSPNVPAFTVLEARITFFDDVLLSGSPQRLSQLMDVWHRERSSLLALAVRHELAHALCKDQNELHAVRVAELLEQRKTPACVPSSRSPRE